MLSERPELPRFDAPFLPEFFGLLEIWAGVVERLRARLRAVLLRQAVEHLLDGVAVSLDLRE